MAIAIKLPDMGTTVDECKVLAWKVKEGDAVKRGDVLADIETDKAVAELESTAEGVLLHCRVPAGASARTGEILAYIGRAGEALTAHAAAAREVENSEARKTGVQQPTSGVSAPAAPGRVSPIVRNLAAKLGVDLSQVKGTGAGGVITREDVQRRHGTPDALEESASVASGQLPRMQAAVARAVQKSWRDIPHLSISASIDMVRAIKLRDERPEGAAKISYDAIFLKALALAAAKHPLFLARLDGERIVRSQGVHIALAVGLGDELHLPVVRSVDQKSLVELHTEIIALAETIKAHALKTDQLSGATMALSNLGMFPIDSFDAIIFPEHSSILTVGSIQMAPVVDNGRLAIRPRVAVKLAADHRLINGRAAAEFVTAVKALIEAADLA
jgi:pyruvate dehydrogenase E2 component (dihydrolipoamide acetyltransferase)